MADVKIQKEDSSYRDFSLSRVIYNFSNESILAHHLYFGRILGYEES